MATVEPVDLGERVTNEPGGLLAALVPASVLVQPEVALTRSIWWLLGLAGAARALDDLVREGGLEPGEDPAWLTEVWGPEGGRTDLEYHWGDLQEAQVVVEAKIGDRLTVEQIGAYRDRMPADGGLLVALLPEARRAEGEQVMAECRRMLHAVRQAETGQTDPVRLAVWSYDQVAAALDAQLRGSGDVAQFKGLLKAFQALDISPFLEAELQEPNDARRNDIWRVVESAWSGLYGYGPGSGPDGGFGVRRYVNVPPYQASFAVGVERKPRAAYGQPRPWAWARVAHNGPYARVLQDAVEALCPGRTSSDAGGLWTPLDIPAGVPGAVMVPVVQEQIEAIATAVRTAIELEISTHVWPAPADLRDFLPAVLGLPPIDAVDLLGTSDRRRADIQLILTQVARALTAGKINPQVERDPDFGWVRYISIDPFGAFVATAMGRRGRSPGDGPQPWAWLRIHRDTPHSDLGFEVLEQLAPGQVVTDDNGRAIPLDLPAGANGPEALQAAHRQLVGAMNAIRTLVAERNASP